MPSHQRTGGPGRIATHWHAAIARINALVDDLVDQGLALVAHRLNRIVESVDRLDGGSGLGLTIATMMARLTGFEVREQHTVVVAHAGRRQPVNRVAQLRERRAQPPYPPTSPARSARTHVVRASSPSLN